MRYDIDEMSNKIKNEKKIKKIFDFIIYTFLTITFTINIIMLYQNLVQDGDRNKIFDIYFFNIVSRKYVSKAKGRRCHFCKKM